MVFHFNKGYFDKICKNGRISEKKECLKKGVQTPLQTVIATLFLNRGHFFLFLRDCFDHKLRDLS